jgi:hypothetical protein
VLGQTYQRATAGRSPRPNQKFRCYIIKIGAGFGFWKAALRITPYFPPVPPGSPATTTGFDGTFRLFRELC